MRVLLLKPPIRACRVEIGRHIPVGLAYLASTLRQADHDVHLFDALSFTEDNHVGPREKYTDVDHVKIKRHPRWKHLVHWGADWDRLVMRSRPGKRSNASRIITPPNPTGRTGSRCWPRRAASPGRRSSRDPRVVSAASASATGAPPLRWPLTTPTSASWRRGGASGSQGAQTLMSGRAEPTPVRGQPSAALDDRDDVEGATRRQNKDQALVG